MSKRQYRILHDVEGQSVSFTSDWYSSSPNPTATFVATITGASSLSVQVKAQATIDNTNWFDLTGTELSITQNGVYSFALSEVDSFLNLRLKFDFNSGSFNLLLTATS